MTKVSLLFPPGWTLCTGSPHVALPALAAALRARGHEATCRDLNIAWTSERALQFSASAANASSRAGTLEAMNAPYFAIEDRLEAAAGGFAGEWNAQLGFRYRASPEQSSQLLQQAANWDSPFAAILDSAVSDIQRGDTHVVGLAVASSHQLVFAFQLARRLREEGFDRTIVIGGNTVTRLLAELSTPWVFRWVDGLIPFQGESALVQLCENAHKPSPLREVAGAVWSDSGTIVQSEATAAPLPDVHSPPDFDDFDLREYWGERYLCLVASRGCYYGKCTFCAIPFGWGAGGFAGTRSPQNVLDDMRFLADRYAVTRFKFVDEALSPSFMRELSRLIREGGFPFEWEGYTRLERAWTDKSFVSSVARGGFRKGYFGLEMLPSDARAGLNKRDSADPLSLLRACDDCGVAVHLFCMFGFPGSGQREAADTTEFLLQHQRLIDTADIFPWALAKHTTVPGTRPIHKPGLDLALEFDHTCDSAGALNAEEVRQLAAKYEEVLWLEVPRLLHPTYRLSSPWSRMRSTSAQAQQASRNSFAIA